MTTEQPWTPPEEPSNPLMTQAFKDALTKDIKPFLLDTFNDGLDAGLEAASKIAKAMIDNVDFDKAARDTGVTLDERTRQIMSATLQGVLSGLSDGIEKAREKLVKREGQAT